MITIKFEREYEFMEATKGTKKFKEIVEPGDTPGLGILYIANKLWEQMGKPESFTMILETD